jgi:hypothetical protein
MPVAERCERFAQMRKNIQDNNLDRWSELFLGALLSEATLGAKAALA